MWFKVLLYLRGEFERKQLNLRKRNLDRCELFFCLLWVVFKKRGA